MALCFLCGVEVMIESAFAGRHQTQTPSSKTLKIHYIQELVDFAPTLGFLQRPRAFKRALLVLHP